MGSLVSLLALRFVQPQHKDGFAGDACYALFSRGVWMSSLVSLLAQRFVQPLRMDEFAVDAC